jgi:hypothetical protein
VDGTLAPVGVFAGSPHCAALCKKTVGQCKAFVRKIVGCYSSLFQIAASFQSQHCADALSTPADVKSCKTIVTSDLRALESGFSATRDSEFTDCETWGSGCAAACAP